MTTSSLQSATWRWLNAKLRNIVQDAPCKCGHPFHEHHVVYWTDGGMRAMECEHYGTNTWGGLKPTKETIELDRSTRKGWLETEWEEHCARFSFAKPWHKLAYWLWERTHARQYQ
jgi:hypothetical protein